MGGGGGSGRVGWGGWGVPGGGRGGFRAKPNSRWEISLKPLDFVRQMPWTLACRLGGA